MVLYMRSRCSSPLSSIRYWLTSRVQHRSQYSRSVVDWISRYSCQPAHCARLCPCWCRDLRRGILCRSQGTTRSRQHVRIFTLIREYDRLKLPSVCLFVGRDDLKWNRGHDLMLFSCYWVHHLNIFQKPRIIIRRRVSCRVVSTPNILGRRRWRLTIPPPFPAEFTLPFVSAQQYSLGHV